MVAFFETEEKEGGRFWQRKELETELGYIGRAGFLKAILPLYSKMGERKRERQILWAMKQLRQRGIHRLAVEKRWESYAQRAGFLTVREEGVWTAGASQAALCVLQKRRIPMEEAFCVLRAKRADRDVLRCARTLAGKVRYLSVQADVGQQGLEEMLYEEFGMAPQQSAPPEYGRVEIIFPGGAREEEREENMERLALSPGGYPGLFFAAPRWAENQKPQNMEDGLYAAMLLESGLIRPEDLRAQLEEKYA